MATAAIAPLSVLGKLFGGIFGQHHAKAVKTEADALNFAVPAILQSWQQIISAANNSQISADDAIQYLNQSLVEYENTVYQNFGVKRKQCNGPCVVEKSLNTSMQRLISVLRSGTAANVQIDQTYANAGYQGTPAFIITYNGQASRTGTVAGMIGVTQVTGTVSPNMASVGSGVIPVNPTATDILSANIQIGNTKIPIWSVFAVGILFILYLVFPSKKQ